MLEDLRTLYELQGRDDHLAALARDRTVLAENLDDAGKRVEDAEQALEEKRGTLEAKQKLYRALESDLKEAEETIRKFKRQEFDVKTNEELWALKKEIEQQEETKSKLEDEALETIEGIENDTAEVKQAEEHLEQCRDELRREKAEVVQKLTSIDEDEAATRKDREERQAGVPEDLLNRYEKVRRHNRGVGVATVRNRACSGCYRLITPQDINLIKRNDRFMFCEGCGAILIWTDSGGEETGGTREEEEASQ